MKYCFILLLTCVSLISCSQSVGVKDKVTTDNAQSVTDFDENDIESMVTYYFASRIRKDDKWKDVLPDPTDWSSRMTHSIEKHGTWDFVEFKNLGLYKGEYGSYVKVHFLIEINGKTDGGEDDVEIEKVDGNWIITKVPT